MFSAPTAVQAFADTHDTAIKPLPLAPGVDSIDYAEPSHRSTRGTPPAVSETPPTAVHALAAVHDTPSKADCEAPPGSGTGTTDHDDPSHHSANANSTPLSNTLPTAIHALADTHDTLTRATPIPARRPLRGRCLRRAPRMSSSSMRQGL